MKCGLCQHEMTTGGVYKACGVGCLLCKLRIRRDPVSEEVAALAAQLYVQLELVAANLERGMGHSMQKLQASSIREVLKGDMSI